VPSRLDKLWEAQNRHFAGDEGLLIASGGTVENASRQRASSWSEIGLWRYLLYQRGEPIFYAFDLVWLNGKDPRGLLLVERKARLRRLIQAHQPERVLYVTTSRTERSVSDLT